MTKNPKFRSTKLPTPMIEKIQKIVDAHPECGWNSVAAFVRDSVTHHPYWLKHTLEFSLK